MEYKVRIKSFDGKNLEEGYVPFRNIQYQNCGIKETPQEIQFLAGEFVNKISPVLTEGKTLEVSVRLFDDLSMEELAAKIPSNKDFRY